MIGKKDILIFFHERYTNLEEGREGYERGEGERRIRVILRRRHMSAGAQQLARNSHQIGIPRSKSRHLRRNAGKRSPACRMDAGAITRRKIGSAAQQTCLCLLKVKEVLLRRQDTWERNCNSEICSNSYKRMDSFTGRYSK